MNANGKLVDVWLLYRCSRCNKTVNITVWERIAISKLPRDLQQRFASNDPGLARQYSTDTGFLRRNGFDIEPSDDVVIRGDAVDIAMLANDCHLVVVHPGISQLRFDKILSTKLDISRSAAKRLIEQHAVEESPTDSATTDSGTGREGGRSEFIIHAARARALLGRP